MTQYQILVTDRSLNVVGDPIVTWTSLDVTLRYNEPSSGVIEMPAYPWIRDQFRAPGYRVVVIRRQPAIVGATSTPGVLVAGPIEQTTYERSDDGENAGVGKLTVNFADDLALVAAHCTYPDPTVTPENQAVDSWTYTGNAETALRTLVNLNAGPGALTARQVTNLALDVPAGVGNNVTVTTKRMQPIGDVMRDIAEVGGGLGFRTIQSGNTILFQVYQPPDVSSSVRFGFAMGNMKYLAVETKAPTTTAAIVGGQGEGADRYMIEHVSAEQSTWGRYETLVSRPGQVTSDTPTLEDDGDKALADGASTVRVSSNVVDILGQQYGTHYQIGSKVAIETGVGEQTIDIVRTVHLQAWPTAGEVVSATVGSQAAQTDPIWVQRLREIDERLGKLERIVVPAS